MRILYWIVGFVVIAFTGMSSCRNSSSLLPSDLPDTIIRKNQIDITYKAKLDTLRSPRLLRMSITMITDSVKEKEDLGVLNHDYKYDSLNFINCVYDTGSIKRYSLNDHMLDCDVYFPTQYGWYWMGNVENNHDTLILNQGEAKILTGYPAKPILSRIRYKIYVPNSFKINRIMFHCAQ